LLTIAFLTSTATRSPAETDRVVADFTWNGVAQPRLLILLDGADVLVPQTVLKRFAAPASSTLCTMFRGACYVSLKALKNELSFDFDETSLTLRVTTATALLPNGAVTVRATPSPYEAAFTKGVVLNYNIFAGQNAPVTGSLEQRVTLSPAVVVDNTIGSTSSGTLERGLTSVTFDSTAELRRTIAGDSEIAGGVLGASEVLGGLTVERAFSMNPYQVTFPTPSLQTTIALPSQAYVYVNGSLVKTLALAPGNYDLNDIPIQSGYSNATVVIRNSFGQQATSLVAYGAPSLLRSGLTDYQYSVGFQRFEQDPFEDGYTAPAASAMYRIGVSDRTTLGGNVQATSEASTAAFEYDGRVGYGAFQADIAGGASRYGDGDAFALSYASASLRSGTFLGVRWQSPSYYTIDDTGLSDALVANAVVSEVRNLSPNTTVSLGFRDAHYRQSGFIEEATASVVRQLKNWNVSVAYARGSHTANLAMTLSRAAGTNANQSIQLQSSGGSGISYAHGSDSPLGTSYVVNASDQAPQLSATAQIGLPFAAVDLDVASQGLSAFPTVSADVGGSIVYGEGRLLFAQPVTDAYAIVSAQGMPGVDVSMNGHDAGRTDGQGYVVLPFLTSFEAASVGLSNAGLPLGEIVDGSDRSVGAGYHSGTIVRFRAERVHAIFGTVRVLDAHGVPQIPAYGEIDVAGSGTATYSSPIDATGRFYLDGIDAGTYKATIEYAGGTCVLALAVPSFSESLHDVGTLRCGR
jgi:outer membrane usher protein